MREVRDGLVMALRRWPTMFALAGMVAVACVVLSLALGDVLSQVAVLRGAKQIRERRAVFFTVYYPHGRVSSVGDDTVRFLIEMIDGQEAYTAIVHNMGIDDPAFAGGYTPLVLFGDAVPDLFPDLQLRASVPSAMQGAQLAGQNLDVSIAGETIPVAGALPAGATLFDPNAAGLPLDRRIVIRAPARMLLLLNPIEREEALARAVMFAPADEVVDAFVSGCAQGGLFLVPHDVTVEQPRRLGAIMMTSAMYIVGMLGFLALVLSAFVSSAHLTIREEMPAFKIRQMYGATAMHVSLRIGSFLAAVVLVLPVALLSFLFVVFVVIGGPVATGALWVMSAVILNFVFLWGRSVRDVLHQDRIGR
ncbi:MAG TPA: hypothetical protein DEQ28_04720 [Clostridiales bacterium]|nr:hypothetical protein [Clostridiales bacterium]